MIGKNEATPEENRRAESSQWLRTGEMVADVVFHSDRRFKSVSVDGQPFPTAQDVEIRWGTEWDRSYDLRVFLPNGEFKFVVDRLNYTVLTKEAEEEMLKETVKVIVKRSEPNPPPVLSVTIDLTPDQASMLRYFFGRLSPAKVRTNVAGSPFTDEAYDPEAIHRMTSSIYGVLLEEGL